MKGKMGLWLFISSVAFTVGSVWTSQIVKTATVVVQSVSDPHPKLTVGGPAVTVRVTGQNLGLATGCAVLLNGVVVKDVSVTLGPAASAYRDVTLKADPNVMKSASGYRIRIVAGLQSIDVPPNIFVMDVVYPLRATGGLVAPSIPVPPVVPPNVDTTRVPTGGRTGRQIVFWGRDFVPDRFVAMIGSATLAITFRSTTEIRAILPDQRMVAPLVVSHGTENSKVQLRPSFDVYGHPVIYTILPFSFNRGDWVDLTGLDLDHNAGPATYSTSSQNPWVMLEDNPDDIGRETLIRADSWTVAADGTSARFQAGDPYDPRVTTLRGKLHLHDSLDNNWDIASRISVTWNMGPALVIRDVYPYQKWNGQNVDFILVKTGGSSIVAEGLGFLPEIRAKMGNIDLRTEEYGFTATKCSFWIPYQATTNYIDFTCGAASARSPRAIKVSSWPRLDPSSYTTQSGVMMIVLNREYTLRGWGFRPSIPGLVIGLNFIFPTPGLPVQLQVLEQTDNLFRFKIATTGSLPSNYMEYREFNSYWQFHIFGQYQGGAAVTMQTVAYRLVAQ